MLRKIFFSFTVIIALFSIVQAQTDTSAKKANDTTAKKVDTATKTPPPVTITGSVDVYYRFNFSSPPNQLTNNYTSFTNSQNSFELGMATIRADHSFGKVGATADLGFGRRAEEFSYNDGGHPTLFAVKQLFLTYQASDKVKLTMGKWGTHIGYEVLDAYANRNYSMDYMFSYGPFFHTGLKADVTLSATTAFMIGIADPTDFSSTTSSTKVLIAQLSTGTKDGKLKAYLNYQGYAGVGHDTIINPATYYTLYKSLNQVDLVVNGTVSSQFGIGLNGTVQSVNSSALGKTASWWGAAVYLNYDPTAIFGLTLRGEYFSDKYGIKINPVDLNSETPGLNVFDLTLSGICKIGSNLQIIPELRLDNGSKQFFYKADGTTTQSTVSAILAAIYKF